MMELKTKRYTAEEFEAFIQLPENRERRFELIGGKIIEKVSTNPLSSEIAANIIFHIKLFLYQSQRKGHVTAEAGGYIVAGERYIPDVAYLSSERQAQMPYKIGYNLLPPELAVEVVSPGNSERELRVKVSNYLLDNVVVWIIYPEEKQVYIHSPKQPVQILNINDTIDGGTILPGFSLPVKEIFPEEADSEE